MSDQESSDRRGAQPDSAPQSGPGQPTAPESESVAPEPSQSVPEASEALGIPQETVRSILRLARKSMRKAWDSLAQKDASDVA